MNFDHYLGRNLAIGPLSSSRSYGYGFEVAHELEVEGKTYRDFDEIMARHMERTRLWTLSQNYRFQMISRIYQ